MSGVESLNDARRQKFAAAIEMVGSLYEEVSGDVQHPQEFGMDGCPVCRARDLIAEAADALSRANEAATLWLGDAT